MTATYLRFGGQLSRFGFGRLCLAASMIFSKEFLTRVAMAPVDWVIAAIVVVSVVGAASSGFFIEAFSLGGVVLGLLIASWNYERLMPYSLRVIHSHQVAEAIAFLLIALGIMVAAGLLGRALRWSAKSIGLGWLDRLAGAAFGLVKGCVLVTLGIMVLAAFFPRTGWLTHSQFAPYFLAAAHTSAAVTPAELEQRIREGVRTIRNAQPDWLNQTIERNTHGRNESLTGAGLFLNRTRIHHQQDSKTRLKWPVKRGFLEA